MAKFTEEEIETLKSFISDPIGDVFVVFPKAMPGMIGAAYARYSRARGGFSETLLREFIKAGELDPKHADELIQRVLIAYGDDSVQELESAWLSLERVSNIATKAIEDRRLAAYIEQSSRYEFYDERDELGRYRYFREPAIMASRHAARYEKVMDYVFHIYRGLIEPMQRYFARRKPIEIAEYAIRENRGKMRYADCRNDAERKAFEQTWRADIRAKTCDTIRILLPAATLTNVGMHANGRTFEHMLRRLYASDLTELQELAAKAHTALNAVIPRYVQRAGRDEYLVETRRNMQHLVAELLAGVAPQMGPAVDLIGGASMREYDNYIDKQIAAMLYPFSELSMRQIEQIVEKLPWTERQHIAQTYIGKRRSRRDRPGRALEFDYPWRFDLMIDFGIYRDLHRHRMLTQERQPLTTRLGFCEIPEEIAEAGYADDVKACAEQVATLYETIRTDLGIEIAQYPVLFGFNLRCFMAFNTREAQHLLELRTQPQGHRSYRRVCQEMYRQMLKIMPWWTKLVLGFVDLRDYDWPRADSEARQRAKEARLPS